MVPIEKHSESSWRQHFPTYTFKDKDIALEEYKVAAKSLESEERVFLHASNITLLSVAALGSLIVGSSSKLMDVFSGIIPSSAITILLLTVVIAFSFVTLKYFADRQKAIVFAGRKVIVLRRMLGLSYGEVQLLLPNWRVEGADQPLSLKLFPGWMTYVSYPFWIVVIISCPVIFFTLAIFVKINPGYIPKDFNLLAISSITIIFLIVQTFVYRKSLLDTHESIRLLSYQLLSRLIGLPVVANTEYIIYRAKLAAYETSRVGVELSALKKFLVFIEDRDYYKHKGVSYKSLSRAGLGLMGLKRSSGGSTITQQLVRTLFIQSLSKTIRRKIMELGLAPWFDRTLGKKDALEIYLSSVRFERGVFGVVAAMNHFWGHLSKQPSNAQAFFLIERISNIQSRLLVNKIIETVRSASKRNLLSIKDRSELAGLYLDAVTRGLITSCDGELTRLVKAIKQ